MQVVPAACCFRGRASTGADGSNAKRKLGTSHPIVSVSPSSPSGSPSTASSKNIPFRPHADKRSPLKMHQNMHSPAASGPPVLSRCDSDGKISKAFGQLLTAEETTDSQCVPNVSASKVRHASTLHVLPKCTSVPSNRLPHADIRPSTCLPRNPFLSEETRPRSVLRDSTMLIVPPAFVVTKGSNNSTTSSQQVEDSCTMFTPPTPNKRVCSQQGFKEQSKAGATVSLSNWPSLAHARKRSLVMSHVANVTDASPLDKGSLLSKEIDLKKRSNAIVEAFSSRPSSSLASVMAVLPRGSANAPKQTHMPPRCRNPGNLSLDLTQMDKANVARSFSRQQKDHAGLCSKVTDFLYIGGVVAAKNKSLLIKHGITHVVNCAASVAPAPFTDDFCYLNLRLRDHASQDLARHFYSMFDFIERARKGGGRIFVHCIKGISRSPTMTIAYLMWYKHIGLYEALDFIRQARPIVDPNAGFIFQLTEWEQQHPNGKFRFQRPVVFRLEVAYSTYDEHGKRTTAVASKTPLFVPVSRLRERLMRDPTQDLSDQCLIVACADYMFVWCGTSVTREHAEVAERGATILQRYEAFPMKCDTVRQGQEPLAFWELLDDLE